MSRGALVFAPRHPPYPVLRPCLEPHIPKTRPLPHPPNPPSSAASLQEPRAARRADGATWRRTGSDSPCELGSQGGGFGGPAQRGDVTTERRLAPPLAPPRSCQYPTWRHRPLPLLCVRVCVRRRWRRGPVGAPRCCSSGSCRCSRGPAASDGPADPAPAPAPRPGTRLGAGPAGGWASACRRAPRGRTGGRASAQERARRGRRGCSGPGRPGNVDA